MPTTRERTDATIRALAEAQQAAKAAGTPFGMDETAQVIVAANADADYTELLDVARRVAGRTGKGATWERVLLDIVREHAPAPARRSAAQIATDRQAILDHVANEPFRSAVQVQPWMRPVDVAALVKAGKLTRTVHNEYDAQGGHAANMFGGAGVMARRRAYLTVAR